MSNTPDEVRSIALAARDRLCDEAGPVAYRDERTKAELDARCGYLENVTWLDDESIVSSYGDYDIEAFLSYSLGALDEL